MTICRCRAFACGFALAAFATTLNAQEIAVPSGVPMRLYDVVLENDPMVARFRFVSPVIDPAGAGAEFGDLVDDLQALCDMVVVPTLAANEWQGSEVVISVSSKETSFGIYDPGVTQFFQPYRIEEGRCIWEDF